MNSVMKEQDPKQTRFPCNMTMAEWLNGCSSEGERDIPVSILSRIDEHECRDTF
jgi:hypothetical protein